MTETMDDSLMTVTNSLPSAGRMLLDRLRQHDEAHSLTVAEADAARGLHLPDVHGLYAGTNDLGDVGAAVDAHGNDTCGKTRKVRDPRNVRQREADHGKSVENEHELHHQGRPADELDVSDRQPLAAAEFCSCAYVDMSVPKIVPKNTVNAAMMSVLTMPSSKKLLIADDAAFRSSQ